MPPKLSIPIEELQRLSGPGKLSSEQALIKERPATPDNFVLTANQGGIRVQWSVVPGVEGYRVAVLDDQDLSAPLFTKTLDGDGTIEWFYDTGNVAVTRFFAVQSFQAETFSEFTSLKSATSTATSIPVVSVNSTRQTRTGATPEAVILTFTVDANSLGANDGLRFYIAGIMEGANNTKTVRIRWDGISGTILGQVIESAAEEERWTIWGIITNRNSTSAQFSFAHSNQVLSIDNHLQTTDTIDTTSSTTLVVTGELVNSADSVHVDLFIIEQVLSQTVSADSSPPSPPSLPTPPEGPDEPVFPPWKQ